jgi:NAD(P)-dependent dehydrogenase (short-subunit alcohol dehydrogenase family)
MNPLQIAIILASTRIVGVHCPGKYSLYSELELVLSPDNGMRSIRYNVISQDDRFGLLVMDIVAPNMTGVIRAFHRPAPQKQEDFTSVRNFVVANEFAKQRALVAGGSRGLGEVVAKLLAAGGADVKITYYQGQDEACALVNEIVSGGGIAACFQYDVLNPEIAVADVCPDSWCPTHLYYFATPPILAGGAGKFSAQKFHRFCDYYVTGLVATLNVLERCRVEQIFCPSSVYVDDPPTNLGEYAAAKAAVETLGAFLRNSCPGVNVYAPRLPRLATDQTSNVAAVASGDPVPVLLAELRAFRALAP